MILCNDVITPILCDTVTALDVCLHPYNNSRTSERILLKFGTYVRSLVATSNSDVFVSCSPYVIHTRACDVGP
jgi:hypothetical protein